MNLVTWDICQQLYPRVKGPPQVCIESSLVIQVQPMSETYTCTNF